MLSKLAPFQPAPPLRSTLLKNPGDTLPSVAELNALQNELRMIRAKLENRAKKASSDQRVIEDTMHRMQASERAKRKTVEKVKREQREFTPISSDMDDYRSQPTKLRLSMQPSGSSISHESSKKKKRKREHDDSEVESVSNRHRKGTPPVALPPYVPKTAAKSLPSAASSSKRDPPAEPPFLVPEQVRLVPERPPVPPPPHPGPRTPQDVVEDFSKLKQPQQTSVNSFHQSIEPWIRNIREEDIGWLEHTGDEVEAFVIPKLGRHYLEIWREHDNSIFQPGEDAPPDLFEAPDPKWDPSTLEEQDCVNELHGHGPLTERVISALMITDNPWKGVKDAEDAMEGRPGGSGAAASKKEKLSVSDLETRIRDTMRYHGLLSDIPDYGEKVDDPISSALRQAQQELRLTMARNKARRKRLVAAARDRIAYQEYLDAREALDKNIYNTYAKLQKKDNPNGKSKRRKLDHAETPTLPPCPAALGLGPDEDNILKVDPALSRLVNIRRQWVDQVGGVFEKMQKAQDGRVWSVPRESIYEGLDEDVQAILEGREPPPRPLPMPTDEMDIG